MTVDPNKYSEAPTDIFAETKEKSSEPLEKKTVEIKLPKKLYRDIESTCIHSSHKCADENAYCKCDGMVYYGNTGTLQQLKNTKYVSKEITDGIECSNELFGGDPLPGVSKNCLCLPSNSAHKLAVKLDE